MLKDKVSPEYKSGRSRRLRRLGNIKKMEHARSFVGTSQDIIVEDREKSGKLAGISANYLRVEFEGDDSLRKKLIKINIDSVNKDILLGDSKNIKQIKKG